MMTPVTRESEREREGGNEVSFTSSTIGTNRTLTRKFANDDKRRRREREHGMVLWRLCGAGSVVVVYI